MMACGAAEATGEATGADEAAAAPCTLFVGGLPVGADAATEAELCALFEPFGRVERAPIVLHRSTQKSRGFGFVTFERANAAAAALAAPQHELRGAQLALRVAQSHDPQWTPPVRVRRRRRQLSDGVVWLENFFSEEEQRALADAALSNGHYDSANVQLSPTGFLSRDNDACSFYAPSYSAEQSVGGESRELKLLMYTLGRHWDVRRGAYADTRTDHDQRPVQPLPDLFRDAALRALEAVRQVVDDEAGVEAGVEGGLAPPVTSEWARCDPDVCIVNLYDRCGRLGLHQDRDESQGSIRKGTPVVSLSFGDTALFEYIEAETLRAHEEARGQAGGDTGAAAGIRASDLDKLPRRSVKLGSGDVLVFGGASRLIYHGVSKILPHSCRVRPWNTLGVKRGRLNLTFRQF